ncbi:hypothetical protein A1D25_09690 [Ursidibacter arcticus]|nr:hypothetical protein A1D25_09690 [Ursidibacter arcticus]
MLAQILPPLAGEVVERSETEGGIYKILCKTHHLFAPYPAFGGTSPVNGGRIIYTSGQISAKF